MRTGVDRAGRHLYPAFPYDHFTNVSDEDDRALYAFLMTRPPVHALPPENLLSFPLNQRPLMAGWKLLFLRRDGFRAGTRAERRMEPRRLSGRGSRPIAAPAIRREMLSAPSASAPSSPAAKPRVGTPRP